MAQLFNTVADTVADATTDGAADAATDAATDATDTSTNCRILWIVLYFMFLAKQKILCATSGLSI